MTLGVERHKAASQAPALHIHLDRLDRYVEKTSHPLANMGDQRALPSGRICGYKAIWKMERNGRRKGAADASVATATALPRPYQRSVGFRRLYLFPLRGRLLLGHSLGNATGS